MLFATDSGLGFWLEKTAWNWTWDQNKIFGQDTSKKNGLMADRNETMLLNDIVRFLCSTINPIQDWFFFGH